MKRLLIAAFFSTGIGCQQQKAPPPDAGPFHLTPDLTAMVKIPGGTFSMGHPVEPPGNYGQPWKENELPAHDVTLAGYAIDRTEVTVSDYAEFLARAGGEAHRHPLQPIARDGFAKRPIAFVSWYDATTYCAWAGKRLPTEAEWERAARGPSDATYPWGEDAPSCARAVHYTGAEFCRDAPADVGSTSPSGDSTEGVQDLAGNVAEWVSDAYASYPDAPNAMAAGGYRVVRGGSFQEQPASLRGTARWAARPVEKSASVGFRCALTP